MMRSWHFLKINHEWGKEANTKVYSIFMALTALKRERNRRKAAPYYQVLATTASSALTALILEIIIIWVPVLPVFSSSAGKIIVIGDHNCDVHQHYPCQMGLPGLLDVQVGVVKINQIGSLVGLGIK